MTFFVPSLRSSSLFLLAWSIAVTSAAFVPSSKMRLCPALVISSLRLQHAARKSANDDADAIESVIPQLPAMGTSSFGSSGTKNSNNSNNDDDDSSPPTAFVGSRKFQLQYTCAICETRNSHFVSRVAYRNGVVIATCKGCDSQHLIADNLGWTDYKGGFQEETNIEEYFANRGQEDNVNRVSPDVFHLERALFHDSKSGSIVGDNGNPALE